VTSPPPTGAVALACAGLLLAGASPQGGDAPVRFDRDVRSLLAQRCFPCHGPDAEVREARLRLDRADGKDGAYRLRRGRAAIAPGSVEESELWTRVTAEDELDLMPPPESHLEALDADELEIVRRWIEGGAPYQDHWAFVTPRRPGLPEVRDEGWVRRPLDHFVLTRLEDEDLTPTPEADRRTLLRRLSLDLTGLPPTRAELAAFLADDAAGAYERQVDRLLASPRFGEHWARPWLDLVRFADTNGVHHDHYRDLTPYRDWVIRAFGENLPYDEFVASQLAGDLFEDATEDQLVASGWHRLHLIIDVGTALPEESYTRNVIDRTTAFGTAFLGLTVQCASCHDHKYDPIAQRDFYSLFAFFNNLDAAPETGGRRGVDFRRGLQQPYVDLPTEEQAGALAKLEAPLGAAEEVLQQAERDLEAGAAEEKEALTAARDQAKAARDALRQERDGVQAQVRAAMVMRERAEPRAAHVLLRGDYASPGEEVTRGTPAFLPPLESAGATPTRLDLARWLTDPAHPLTARVAVNRFWQQLFGVGLVETAEDLGTQGEFPSHPELLDYLALEFVASGWDVKALLRRLLLSATYRQSSRGSAEAFAADPANHLLARGGRYRLDAEVIRDQVLFTSGLLNEERYGRSVKPPQPTGIWKAVTLPDSNPRVFQADDGPAKRRRSVYTFWKRALPPPQMTILNAPSREFCTARRERTNTPLQALLLMNEPEYLAAARHLARTTLAEESDPRARLERIVETITSHLPDEEERAVLRGFTEEALELYAASPELAAELCGDEEPSAELAAWTMLVSAVHNLDRTRTRE